MQKEAFVFISDFDGTFSKKDFYQIIIDQYMGPEGMKLYQAWKAGDYLDKDFLNLIYSSINRNEEEIMEDILRIPLDEGALSFVEQVKKQGGKFVILSAGTSYYIERLLKANGVEHVTVHSNPSVYKDRGIHLQLDETGEFYSPRYGIDKAKVVEYYKKKYEKVYFAGDSQPDIAPSKLADVAFAKSQLQEMLRQENIAFVPVDSFFDIADYMKQEGVFA